MSKPKFGVVVFPGSNCDQDCIYVLRDVLGCQVKAVWHKESGLGDVDAVVLPGGFSYGDYLRTGAIARFSPIMKAVVEFANQGKPVLGICNGFQILLESGLLPGAIMRNRSLNFECSYQDLSITSNNSSFTKLYKKDQKVKIPVAHGEGNYYADAATIEKLKKNDQILVSYVNNPNGSLENIAGICNEKRNVFGLMPHPERSSENTLGSTDGKLMFESLVRSIGKN